MYAGDEVYDDEVTSGRLDELAMTRQSTVYETITIDVPVERLRRWIEGSLWIEAIQGGRALFHGE